MPKDPGTAKPGLGNVAKQLHAHVRAAHEQSGAAVSIVPAQLAAVDEDEAGLVV
jgi:hypothetical protein